MKKLIQVLLTAMACALPLAAQAHTGHGEQGFSAGFMHPFLGIDHLVAMLVVGIWSVLNLRRAWLAPLCFVALLTVGALAGQNGFSLPQQEPLVAASVFLLGLMLTKQFKLGTPAALVMIASFAFCHGLAHGSELSTGGSVLAGIVLGSILLHGIGMLLAQRLLLQQSVRVQRLGQAVALLGGGLFLNALI